MARCSASTLQCVTLVMTVGGLSVSEILIVVEGYFGVGFGMVQRIVV